MFRGREQIRQRIINVGNDIAVVVIEVNRHLWCHRPLEGKDELAIEPMESTNLSILKGKG